MRPQQCCCGIKNLREEDSEVLGGNKENEVSLLFTFLVLANVFALSARESQMAG